MRASLFAVFCVLVLPFSAPAHDFHHGHLTLSHPWIAETPPGAPSAAGYLGILNGGDEADRLISVTADFAGRVEVHSIVMTDDGVMQMRPVEGGLEIPAGQEVMLEPGGYHVMFMQLDGSFKEGGAYEATATFEHAGEAPLVFNVEKRDGAMGMDAHDHGEDGS